jgi:hypothetical protein
MTLTLTNNMDIQRIDQPVVITRGFYDSLFGEIPEGMLPVLRDSAGTLVSSQLDDLDGDDKWDELALVLDFDSMEQKILTIHYVDYENVPEYKFRTNIRFAKILEQGGYEEIFQGERIDGEDTKVTSKHFQMEGPAWENDKVGYRNYFDRRNSMDIFGKVTDEMILDSVGINEDYHTMQDWGMDILKVGSSLGAGALALLVNDSIYRICMTCKSTYELITEGPVRSVLELRYNDFEAAGQVYNLTHEIAIWAGSYAYDSKVTIENARGDEELVLGIVNMHSDSLMVVEHNDQFVSILTHDNQSFNEEFLGMSVLMNKANYSGKGETPEAGDGITQTYYAKIRMGADPVEYSFYAGWEKTNPDFRNTDMFKQLIQEQSDRKKYPISVSN